MAGHFKKRRGPQGPNKNEAKVIRAKNEESRERSAGTLSSRFPTVKNLRIHLTFLDPRQQVMDQKDIDLNPSDAPVFAISCPGRCGRGSFDFSKKVADTIEGRLAASDAGAKCAEELYAASTEACGWELRCRLEIVYLDA